MFCFPTLLHFQNLNYDPEEQERVSTEKAECVLVGTYLRDVLLPGFMLPPLDSFALPQASTVPLKARVSSFAPSSVGGPVGGLEGAGLKSQKDAKQHLPSPSPPPPPILSPGIFSLDQRIHSWARRYRVPGHPVVVEGDPDLGALNATQRRAVAVMVGERVSLVQGVSSKHLV